VALIIDGKAIAAKVRAEVAERAQAFAQRYGRPPGLEVILVGDDPGSQVYVRNKEKSALEAGFAGNVQRLPAATSEGELLERIAELNARDDVDGILVQFPVPPQISQARVIRALDPQKDVDGLTAENAGALASGDPGLIPCTPRGCIRLLKEIDAPLVGARAVVVGRSNLVGKPIAQLLLSENATVTIAHSKTRDLAGLCRSADILVAAIGRAKMLGEDFIKPGAIVIDVGMNRDETGKLCGDVDFAAASALASAITPVPGGVGPMTIAMLLENTVIAAEARRALNLPKAPATSRR
jgi:methylenetetrahydrofolate dehydrogenase (NADP+)/methenyltetrahydrofolate cyclohydrolase